MKEIPADDTSELSGLDILQRWGLDVYRQWRRAGCPVVTADVVREIVQQHDSPAPLRD